MKRGTCRFIAPADVNLEDVVTALRPRFSLRMLSTRSSRRRYFDSFDGLLYMAGTAFYQDITGRKKQLCWQNLADAATRHVLATDEVPRFADQLPPGRFRDDLASVLKHRALLPLAEAASQRRIIRILNTYEKTVVRVVVDENTASASQDASISLGALLTVVPVKGYDAAFAAVCAALRRHPGLSTSDAHPLLLLLQALGRSPAGTPSKYDLVLDPAMRADQTLKRILRALFETLLVNEPGVRADLDSEFLHDYRVAVRRTRSVLSQFKGVLPSDLLNEFRPAFKWLGGLTGPTRDLDVYLLKFETYLSWLPARVQHDLHPLRDFLDTLQKKEHTRLAKGLDSARYRTLCDRWHAFLHQPVPATPHAPEAAFPVLRVASERIWQAHRKVLKQGQAILRDPHTPADKLHDLRITCKKLRYLLELFRSLYPVKKIHALIQALKQLQENLGDYNDYEVQQDKLQLFAIQMMQDGHAPAETLLALGRLEARLDRLQQETRAAFNEQFTRFATQKNQRRFQKLFKQPSL